MYFLEELTNVFFTWFLEFCFYEVWIGGFDYRNGRFFNENLNSNGFSVKLENRTSRYIDV